MPNFTYEWRDLQFKVGSERQIFEKPFHVNFIHSQSFFWHKLAARQSPKEYFNIFRFVGVVGTGA